MAKAGKRYPLLVYEHILNRWLPATFFLSFVLAGLWWLTLPDFNDSQNAWRSPALLGIVILTFLFSLFLLFMRKAAYVRPYPKYLRLVTPFLRLNISYKRIHKTAAAEMRALFPPKSLSTWTRENMAPLLAKTAIVLEFKSDPMPRSLLRFFLSPFFFKDDSPHLVILVEDWMRFSTELESYRSGAYSLPAQKKRAPNDLLSRLPRGK